jgi:Uma2 family endonuclease
MSTVLRDTESLPGHLDLPDTDGLPLENSIEQIQNLLLTSSLRPILDELHPDEQYFIGHDVGIYYDPKNPKLSHCRAPDWFYVPNTSPFEPNDGTPRRSFVTWQEQGKLPYLIIEQVSKQEGKAERNRKPGGKMWVYETILKTPYYAIFDGFDKEAGEGKLEVYRLEKDQYVVEQPDANGRFLIPAFNVLLGMEDGPYHKRLRPWLRFYDLQGNLLLSGDEQAIVQANKRREAEERAEIEGERANAEAQARQEAEERAYNAEAEIARLREMLRQQQGKSHDDETKG